MPTTSTQAEGADRGRWLTFYGYGPIWARTEVDARAVACVSTLGNMEGAYERLPGRIHPK